MPVCIAAHLIYRSCTRKSLIIFSVEQKNVKKEYKNIHTQPSACSTAKRQEKKKRNRQNRKMKKQQATALIEEERSGSGQTTVSEDSSEHISKTTTAVLPPVLIDMFRSLKRAYPDMPYWMLRRLYIVYNEWEIEYQNVLFSRYKTVDDDLEPILPPPPGAPEDWYYSVSEADFDLNADDHFKLGPGPQEHLERGMIAVGMVDGVVREKPAFFEYFGL
jgi:hypothetical protein